MTLISESTFNETIERLGHMADNCIYKEGGRPFVMSLDDGIAVITAIDLLKSLKPFIVEIEADKSGD